MWIFKVVHSESMALIPDKFYTIFEGFLVPKFVLCKSRGEYEGMELISD